MTLDARLARLERVAYPSPQQDTKPTWSDDDRRNFEDAMAAETALLTPAECEQWTAWYTRYNALGGIQR